MKDPTLLEVVQLQRQGTRLFLPRDVLASGLCRRHRETPRQRKWWQQLDQPRGNGLDLFCPHPATINNNVSVFKPGFFSPILRLQEQ